MCAELNRMYSLNVICTLRSPRIAFALLRMIVSAKCSPFENLPHTAHTHTIQHNTRAWKWQCLCVVCVWLYWQHLHRAKAISSLRKKDLVFSLSFMNVNVLCISVTLAHLQLHNAFGRIADAMHLLHWNQLSTPCACAPFTLIRLLTEWMEWHLVAASGKKSSFISRLQVYQQSHVFVCVCHFRINLRTCHVAIIAPKS